MINREQSKDIEDQAAIPYRPDVVALLGDLRTPKINPQEPPQSLLESIPEEYTRAEWVSDHEINYLRLYTDSSPLNSEAEELYNALATRTDKSLQLEIVVSPEQDSAKRLLVFFPGGMIKLDPDRIEKFKSRKISHARKHQIVESVDLNEIVRTTLPEDLGPWTLDVTRSSPSQFGVNVAFLRIDVPRDRKKEVQEWREALEEQYQIPIIIQPDRTRGMLKRQLLNQLPDGETSLTDPGIVEKMLRNFHGSVIPESPERPEFPKKLPGLMDFREDPTFTIDPKGSDDLDDAFLIEEAGGGTIILRTFISDVSWRLDINSPEVFHSRRASQSMYSWSRRLALLDDDMAREQLSLLPGQDRLSWMVTNVIDQSGKTISTTLDRAMIRSQKQFSFENFEAERQDVSESIQKQLELLEELEKRLRINRLGRHVPALPKNVGNRFVEEAMILTNKTLAQYLDKEEIPYIRKVQSPPSKAAVGRLLEKVREEGFEQVELEDFTDQIRYGALLRMFLDLDRSDLFRECLAVSRSSSYYTMDKYGHSGLNTDAYLQFKGIRTHIGLINQLSVARHYEGKEDFATDLLEAEARNASRKKEAHSDNLFRFFRLLRLQESLERIGEEFELSVLRKYPDGDFKVHSSDLRVRGRLEVEAGEVPGRKVRAALVGYDVEREQFIFKTTENTED